MIITKDHIKKFKSFASKGFTKGKGNPVPGECCIEVAISTALGLPVTDHPSYVMSDVADIKIFLNDRMPFNDNLERAKLLRFVGIAQLGSDSLDPKAFKEKFLLKEKEFLIPISFDLIPTDKRIPEHNELKQFWIDNWKDKEKILTEFKDYNHYYYYYYHYYNNYNHYYNHYYYNYNYYNYYNYYYNYNETYRDCLIKILLDILIEMKSPGCKFLPKPKKKKETK